MFLLRCCALTIVMGCLGVVSGCETTPGKYAETEWMPLILGAVDYKVESHQQVLEGKQAVVFFRNKSFDVIDFNAVISRDPITYPIMKGSNNQDGNVFIESLAPGSQRRWPSVQFGQNDFVYVFVSADHLVKKPVSGSPLQGLD